MPDNAQGDVWSQLKAAFRSACSFRIAGDQAGAVSVLRDEVPGLVAAWAKTSDLNPAEKKQRLKSLFEDESDRAEELATISELFAEKFESILASQVAQRVLDEIRPELEQLVCDRMAKLPPIQEITTQVQAFDSTGAEDELGTEAEETLEPEQEVPEPPAEIAPVEAEEEVVTEEEVAFEPEQEVPESPAEIAPVEAEKEEVAEAEMAFEPGQEVSESPAEIAPVEAEEEVAFVPEQEVPEPPAETPSSEDHLHPKPTPPLEALPGTEEGVTLPVAAESVESVAPEVQMTSDPESQHLPQDTEELPEDSTEEGETAVEERPGRISFDDIEGLIDRILDET